MKGSRLTVKVTPRWMDAHTPVVELPVGPRRLPASVLHGQSHLLQVPRVSVHEGRIYGFMIIRSGLRLRGCLTQTPSWETNKQIREIEDETRTLWTNPVPVGKLLLACYMLTRRS